MQHATCNNRRKPSVYPGKRRFQSVGLNVTFIVSPGLGKLRRKDEGVKAGLVDEGHVLIPSKGVPFCYPLYPQSQCGRGLLFEHCGTPVPESFNVTEKISRLFPKI